MKRTAIVAAGVLAAGVALTAAPHAVAGPTVEPTVTPSPITWTDCSAQQGIPHLQCGTLKVPMDYSDPDGKQITLALSRIQHTSSDADYQGVVLMNPGGPGGSGLWLPELSSYIPNKAAVADYDWIGWDPRGVGSSKPALNCKDQYFPFDRPDYVPTTQKIMTYWQVASAHYAASCAFNAPSGLLDNLKTTDNVADMESIREALGQDQINYYGFSYGTYIGEVYATLHPDRVRRMVLDGVVDSSRVWYKANLDQDVAFDSNMDVFWKWVAKHPKAFHLGKNWHKIKQHYNAEYRYLKRHPWHKKLGPDELNDALVGAGYYVYGWPQLAKEFAQLWNHGNGAGLLAEFASGDHADGNGFAVYNGTQCTDAAWPQSWSTWSNDAWRIYRHHPFMAWNNTWYNTPCMGWGAKAGTPVKVSGADLTSKILLMSETKDAATPYSGALATRQLFPSASLIAGMGGTTHASSLSGVACVDDTIGKYFADGSVPARKSGNGPDLKCPALKPPPANSASARMVPKGALPWKYRQLLSSPR